MSSIDTQKICCPKCGYEQDFTVWNSVNVTLDPNAKERIKSGEMFRFECENCAHSSSVSYVCLYHDMDKGIMIYLLPGLEEKDKDAIDRQYIEFSGLTGGDKPYISRSVADVNELREKVLIFDDGLDDRIIELAKFIYKGSLVTNNPQLADAPAYYESTSGERTILFLTDEGAYSAALGGLYTELSRQYDGLLDAQTPGGFCAIDERWAVRTLSKQLPVSGL